MSIEGKEWINPNEALAERARAAGVLPQEQGRRELPTHGAAARKYNGQVRCACGCKYWKEGPGGEVFCVDCGRDILNYSPQINAINDGTPLPDQRVAVVELSERDTPERELERVRAYLPRNFVAYLSATHGELGVVRIHGYDNAGWTLRDYVIPRLASGLIFPKEVTQ
jgi:hypothetical protein